MLARAVTLLVWLALGASAVAWSLQLFVRGTPVPAQARAGSAGLAAATAAGADWQRVLGPDRVVEAAPATPAPAEPGLEQRLTLIGIAGTGGSRAAGGVALIALDGKPPRAYRVGQPVEGRHVLQRVSLRVAEIGPPGLAAVARLELPELPPASTGTLPAADAGPSTPPVAAPVAATPGAAPRTVPRFRVPMAPPGSAEPSATQLPQPPAPMQADLPPQRGAANAPNRVRTP